MITLPGRQQNPAPSSSLRRQGTHALLVIFAVVLIGATGTVFCYRAVVGQYRSAARRLQLEGAFAAQAQATITAHEELAHTLWDGGAIDLGLYAHQQTDIAHLFDTAITDLRGTGQEQLVRQAFERWQDTLTSRGLWAPVAQIPTETRTTDEQRQFGSDSDQIFASMYALNAISLSDAHHDIAQADRFQSLGIGVLALLFGLLLAVLAYVARRLQRDILRPIGELQSGVARLHDGAFDHRVQLEAETRATELRDLATGFNAMAAAIAVSHRELDQQATHDSLTGLANRAALERRMRDALMSGEKQRGTGDGVLFIDVDDFKLVNDSLGHAAGDGLLSQIAQRLTRCVRPEDFLARLGGDEFAILVRDNHDGTAAATVADRVVQACADPFLIAGQRVSISVSVGLSGRNTDAAAEQLLTQADFAMYMAKGHGKGRYEVFDAAVHQASVDRAALRADLGNAVAASQLVLEYQPVFDLKRGRVIGCEALVRWHHPERGLLPPAEFIPLAEETGDIDAIGAWVLETAAHQAAMWRKQLPGGTDLWMAVNLSAYQLRSENSITALCRILRDPLVDPAAIVLEVTESALVINHDGGTEGLRRLKEAGVRIALDDFGTGFSSLSTLQTLAVDILKIDRSFVSGTGARLRSAAMVETIMTLAAKLGLSVIAEGIEQPEQRDSLNEMGCPLGQGYGLGRPGTADALRDLIAYATGSTLPDGSGIQPETAASSQGAIPEAA